MAADLDERLGNRLRVLSQPSAASTAEDGHGAEGHGGEYKPDIDALWISHFPVFGGPHNIALQLAAPLRSRGVETTFLLPDEPGTAVARLRAGGVPVVCVPLRRVRRTRDPRVHAALLTHAAADVMRIRRVIRAGGHDLVVLTGLLNPQGALAARLEGVPIVWQLLDTATPAPAARRADGARAALGGRGHVQRRARSSTGTPTAAP